MSNKETRTARYSDAQMLEYYAWLKGPRAAEVVRGSFEDGTVEFKMRDGTWRAL